MEELAQERDNVVEQVDAERFSDEVDVAATEKSRSEVAHRRTFGSGRVSHGRARSAAALLAFAAVACRAPVAAREASPVTAPAASPEAVSVTAPPPTAESQQGRLAPVAVDVSPGVLVTPSGNAYLVLRAGADQVGDGLVWGVVYLAGTDAAELAHPEAEARLASIARDLLDAFRPLAETARAKSLLVTAVFGKPGATGAIAQLRFTRDEGRWRADGNVARRAVAPVPPVDIEVVRDRDEEASARVAAAEFLADSDRADYDAAWARTSAVVKAVMSRTEFERHVTALSGARPRGELYLSFSTSVERFVPGVFMVAWLALDTAEGPGVQAVVLRLDDDLEWRVAGLATATAFPDPPVALGDGRTL